MQRNTHDAGYCLRGLWVRPPPHKVINLGLDSLASPERHLGAWYTPKAADTLCGGRRRQRHL